MTRIADGRDAGAFITAALDDFGLDMPCFRIYARIVRRSGTKMGCFESIDNMAKACRMNRDTAYTALRTLLKHRLIEKEPHPGKPSSYYLTPASEWIPLDTYPKSGDTPPIPNEGIPPIPNEGIPPIPNQGIPPIPNEGIRREKGREKIREEQEGGKNLPVLDAGKEDPFFSGQHRAIAREVVKVSREISGPRNFITDAPWGKLAEETGKDALGVWREFERYMIALHSDKKDPQVYVGKIATNLYQNPGTEHACKPWVEFAECFRKTLAAPTPRQKPTAPRPKVIEIPDREASARAIREARRA